MKIYTSYFGRRNYGDLIPVSVSLWPPKGFNGLRWFKIAPTKEMLLRWKTDHNEYEYKYHYWHDVLKQYRPTELYEELKQITNNRDCVLLCYEKPGDFCHRHLFATWMTKNGFPIKELET